ncbi:hypothetical protein [Desulfovibrio sp. DV]|uniref:hypothetical protein n=1 Tax=Desulfovibrio sp. DV TaxID=1844708 RepID=UPI00111524F1|nr:hypothetical protein [Desulfovibrio sp. DV]
MEYLITARVQSLLDSGQITINDFEPQFLGKDNYRFRAGQFEHKGKVVQQIALGPMEYAKCLSLEYFSFPTTIIGDISQISDNALDGIILNKSDYIDRKFEGCLRLGIFNMSSNIVKLNRGDAIGKIYFYQACNEEMLGCFDSVIEHTPCMKVLEDRFKHRATTTDFEKSNRNLIPNAGEHWF